MTATTSHSLPGPNDTLRQTLPNGITVLARENFASPAVVVHGYLEAGALDEPAELMGLASFTADVMGRGTRRRSFEDLYEEVESVGASFGLSGGTHTSSFGGKGLAEQLPRLLDILSDVLREPAFAPDQIEKERGELLTDLRERAHDTRRMASLAFNELVYPADHPYHGSLDGYPETLQRITRDDMVQFHQRYFSPQGLVIVIVGAVKANDAVKAVNQAFGGWRATRPARAPLPPAPAIAETRERRIAIPEKTQSDLQLGWPGPERRSPDFLHCYLANTVLGVFGMMGRLGKVVREANGLAYYVYSRVDGGSGPGPWRVIAGVNPANVERTVELTRQELRRLCDERVPEEELADSQAYLTGILPLQLETNEGVAQTLINIERYELGLDYLQHYSDAIKSITPEEVQAAAQRWLDPDHFALAVAGPGNPD